jgi:chemotaxis protein MotB
MEEENNSWINIADIMSALMMMFMFISVSFLFKLQNEREIYRVELNQALHKEFDKDLKKWGAEITDNNIFRFNSPFTTGNDKIPDNYKENLRSFFPRYVHLLTNDMFKNEISEIRVEGHTSNSWGKDYSSRNIYLNNMKLSQQRANKVLTYSYKLDNKIIYLNQSWLEKHLMANGMSYSNPLYIDKEKTIIDHKKSRRVEFKVVLKSRLD